MGVGQALVDGNYRPGVDVDVPRLHALGRDWIRRHGDIDREAA